MAVVLELLGELLPEALEVFGTMSESFAPAISEISEFADKINTAANIKGAYDTVKKVGSFIFDNVRKIDHAEHPDQTLPMVRNSPVVPLPTSFTQAKVNSNMKNKYVPPSQRKDVSLAGLRAAKAMKSDIWENVGNTVKNLKRPREPSESTLNLFPNFKKREHAKPHYVHGVDHTPSGVPISREVLPTMDRDKHFDIAPDLGTLGVGGISAGDLNQPFTNRGVKNFLQ